MNKIDKVNSLVKISVSIPKEDADSLKEYGDNITTLILDTIHNRAESIRSGCPDMEKQKGLSNIIIACAKEYLNDMNNRMDYIENGKVFSDKQYQDVYRIASSKYDVMTSLKSVITVLSKFEGALC